MREKETGPLITIEAPIGAGKSTLTKLLSDILGSTPVYEPIADNELLDKFYENKEKYGFVFQISMISKRFDLIKKGLIQRNSVLDRSIYGDRVFVDLLVKRGEIDPISAKVYYDLLDTMLEELEYIPSKTPDLMVYIHLPLELELERIEKRGRDFEQLDADPGLLEYYTQHNEMYNDWFLKFDKCPKLVLDATKYDFANNEEDAKEVLTMILAKLVEVGALSFKECVIAFSKLYGGNPKEVAIQAYNHVQTEMNGDLPYHELSSIFDNKLFTIEDLQKYIDQNTK